MRRFIRGPVPVASVLVSGVLLAGVSSAAPLRAQQVQPAQPVSSPGTPVSRSDLGQAVSRHVATNVALRALLAEAPARGIPVDPLLTKVREGISKGSDADRIREAVRVLAERLETARRELAPGYSVGELTAGAGALQSGVSPSTLRELRRVWPDRPLTVPLGVLTEMVADGVPSRSASGKLRELMVKGASGAQLIALGSSVRADVAAGYAPGTALELRSKGVLSLLAQPFKSTIVGPATTPIRPR